MSERGGRADVVVVGGGTAGCVVAARLSADPARSVMVLEAGPAPRSAAAFDPALLDAGAVPGARGPGPHVDVHDAALSDGRPWGVVRGRVLGGSSTVNGGYFVRARRSDFARWAATCPAWAFDRVLPVLRSIEDDLDFGATAVHGAGGPVPVQRGDLRHPQTQAFVAGAAALGFPAEPDKNDPDCISGFGPVPLNVRGGVRVNSALAYLLPAMTRSNLVVRGGCVVRRVLLRAGRAVGVEMLVDGVPQRIDADVVVVCAGAIASAHLLMVSGVGPAAQLARHGLAVAADLPGVGAAFDDHPQVVLESAGSSSAVPPPAGRWMGAALNTEISAETDTAGTDATGVEILQSLAPVARLTRGQQVTGPLPYFVSVQQRRRTGTIDLVSGEPGVAPRVHMNYLRDASSRSALRAAVRLAADVLGASSARTPADAVIGLGRAELADDGVLDGWIAARLGTAFHTCATAPMGPAADPSAVVDQFGSVHAVDGLRVADASILPTSPARGPANTALLIGELVAADLAARPA